MNILYPHPRKTTWKLWQHLRKGEKDPRITTGYQNTAYRIEGAHQVPNFVFAADLKLNGSGRGRSSATFYLMDRDRQGLEEHHTFSTGISGMTDIMLSLQEGKVTLVDGYIRGAWTFMKQGQEVYVTPWETP